MRILQTQFRINQHSNVIFTHFFLLGTAELCTQSDCHDSGVGVDRVVFPGCIVKLRLLKVIHQ